MKTFFVVIQRKFYRGHSINFLCNVSIYSWIVAKVDWWDFDDAGFLHQAALKPGEDPYAKHNFNQVISDKMKPDRSVPDTRSPQCALKNYEPENYPSTSVIIAPLALLTVAVLKTPTPFATMFFLLSWSCWDFVCSSVINIWLISWMVNLKN